MTTLRRLAYIILTSLLAVLSYLFLQTGTNSTAIINKVQFIDSSAIVLPSDYEPIVKHQARIVQATWFILPYRKHIKPWQDESYTQTYYQQQKTALGNQPYEAVRYQLAQELAQKQAIKENYYEAEKWREQLNNKNITTPQIPQAIRYPTQWVSAYQQDIDADVIRLLLSSHVKKWQTHELPSGDTLVSFVFMRDQDNSRIGLIRRLTENSTFTAFQTAEKAH